MQTLILWSISVLAWIWYLVPRNRPLAGLVWRILALGAIGGGLSALCALALNELGMSWTGVRSPGGASMPAALLLFLWVGIVEESSKAFWAAFLARRVRRFSEPLDGVLHASAVALGFASIENLLYMSGYGDLVLLPRSLTAVPLHLTLSTIWGLALTRARILNAPLAPRMIPAVLLTAAVHGAYDFTVLAGSEMGGAAALAVLVLTSVLTFRHINRRLVQLRLQSPAIPAGTCLRCATVNPIGSRFCGRCGSSLEREFYIECPVCGARTEKSARFCPACGSELG
jgi:RsiW-degrading membrane proteinase PrsW (M82 family)